MDLPRAYSLRCDGFPPIFSDGSRFTIDSYSCFLRRCSKHYFYGGILFLPVDEHIGDGNHCSFCSGFILD